MTVNVGGHADAHEQAKWLGDDIVLNPASTCLTAREAEVLVLVARGMSNQQIGEQLVIRPKTAANHVDHIYAKIRRLQPGGRGDVRGPAQPALRGDHHHNRGTLTLGDDI
jgi:hypothetical protein